MFACVRVDLVEDVVNWLRLTFSRGIVKGTVPPRLWSERDDTLTFYIKYYFEGVMSQ